MLRARKPCRSFVKVWKGELRGFVKRIAFQLAVLPFQCPDYRGHVGGGLISTACDLYNMPPIANWSLLPHGWLVLGESS